MLALPAIAGAALKEGVDYELVTNAAPVPVAGEQVYITEYFNYSCPACNAWYPSVEEWLENKPAFVTWERTPLEFTRYNGLFARTQYVLEAFKRKDLASKVYQAIHKERKLLNSEGRIAEWLAEEHGLDEDAAEAAFSSFGVTTKMNRAKRRADQYGIQSTPSFVVANRYLVTPAHTRGPEKLFSILGELAQQVYEGNAPR